MCSEAAFEGGKWGNHPRPRSFDKKKTVVHKQEKNFMNNGKTKFMRQVAKVYLV